MATVHNTLIRKFGDMAILITVTDWNDFKEVEKFGSESSSDFLVSSTTTNSIYSNMQPTMQVNTYEAIDITEGTKGMGLAGIITEGCDMHRCPEHLQQFAGGIWGYRKAGLTYAETISKPDLSCMK